jgi:flagellar biogenesis protein FliO
MGHMRFLHRLFLRPVRLGGARRAMAAAWCLCLAAGAVGASQPASAPAPATRPGAGQPPTSAPATATAPSGDKSISRLGLRDDRGRRLPTLSEGDGDGLLGRMLAYGAVILLLGGAAVFMARRYLPRARPAGGRRVRVTDSVYLGPRKQLHVLEVGPQRFLIASCRDSVTMISELTSSFSELYEDRKAEADREPRPAAGRKEEQR